MGVSAEPGEARAYPLRREVENVTEPNGHGSSGPDQVSGGAAAEGSSPSAADVPTAGERSVGSGSASAASSGVGDARSFSVHGTVVSPDRPGVGGLSVQIVDRNVGSSVPLVVART